MASEDSRKVHFGPTDLGHVLGREALRRLDLDGDHHVHLQAIVEKSVFKEIVVRVAPQIDADRDALARHDTAGQEIAKEGHE